MQDSMNKTNSKKEDFTFSLEQIRKPSILKHPPIVTLANASRFPIGAIGRTRTSSFMPLTLEATKGAAEKPSLTGALKENAGKVKEQPAKPAPASRHLSSCRPYPGLRAY